MVFGWMWIYVAKQHESNYTGDVCVYIGFSFHTGLWEYHLPQQKRRGLVDRQEWNCLLLYVRVFSIHVLYCSGFPLCFRESLTRDKQQWHGTMLLQRLGVAGEGGGEDVQNIHSLKCTSNSKVICKVDRFVITEWRKWKYGMCACWSQLSDKGKLDKLFILPSFLFTVQMEPIKEGYLMKQGKFQVRVTV